MCSILLSEGEIHGTPALVKCTTMGRKKSLGEAHVKMAVLDTRCHTSIIVESSVFPYLFHSLSIYLSFYKSQKIYS